MACKIQLSDLVYVDRRKKEWGRALRFSIGMRVDCENGLFIETVMDGCLAFYSSYGELMWSPPMAYFGTKKKNVVWVNSTYYNVVLDTLLEHPELLKNLKTDLSELLKKQPIKEVDSDLPLMLEKET